MKTKKQEQEEGRADSGVKKKKITVHYAKFVLVANHHGVSLYFLFFIAARLLLAFASALRGR
jgi:hypothetical protein